MPQHRGAWYTIPNNMSMETYIFAQEWRVEGSPPGKRLTDDDVGARLGLEPRRRRRRWVGRMPRGRWGHEGWPGTISLPCRSMADSPLRAQRKSCYLAEGIEETTALVAAERDHDLLVYYFIVVHQSAEPGREADVARGGTDRPTLSLFVRCRHVGKRLPADTTSDRSPTCREHVGCVAACYYMLLSG